ncbi:MAG: putative NAD/FAD-binding protein [Psychrobacter glaciei]|jgi:predicted NAD/FAD-binding protein
MFNIDPLVSSQQTTKSQPFAAKASLAVIGGGLAGLSAAWLLKDKYDVTLFESHERVGMGVFTADYHSNGISTRIDIPLRIFTKGYYPQLFALYDHLNIEMESSDHSSVFQTSELQPKTNSSIEQVAQSSPQHSPAPVSPFFQYNNVKLMNKPFRYLSRNSLNVESLKLLLAHTEFFKQANKDVADNQGELLKSITFRQYLSRHSFNQSFIHKMLLPALSVTCTCDYEGIFNYPADVILGYLTCGVMDDGIVRAKQGVDGIVPKITQGYKVCCAEEIQSLTFSGRPQDRILLTSKNKNDNIVKSLSFDKVVVATQADIAQKILASGTGQCSEDGLQYNSEDSSVQAQQAMLLARIPMQCSSMTLHTDTSVVYNYKKAAPVSYIVNGKESSTSVDLTKSFSTYRLQQPIYQTWNAHTEINPDHIIRQQQFTRPLVTLDSRQAVSKLKQLNHNSPIKIVGSYMANKIPLLDAAVESSVDIAQQLGCEIPWIKSNALTAV